MIVCGKFDKRFDRAVFGTVFDGFTCDIPLTVNAVYACANNKTPVEDESYRLTVQRDDGMFYVAVACGCRIALIRGLFEIKRRLRLGVLCEGVYEFVPKFAVRGYIEGFYGRPWTYEQRLDMLRFMAENGENTYYYAPKDDPYHRKLWRELYPAAELKRLKNIADTAHACGITMHYCIAPGLSMRYSSEDDVNALWRKLDSLYDIGIKNFGLLLDDIPERLFHEQDRDVYGETVNAHVDLCLRCYEYLKSKDKSAHLTVCPMQYHGKGTEDFITVFGSALPADISVFFTGDDICSKELTCREADIFERSTGHKPLYWDNFPVNDAEMFKEMHLAPVIGRDAELYKHSDGIISNCMEYFECNRFSLMTVADYLREPTEYAPEVSFANALKVLLDDNVRDHFALFADHLRTSCLHDENSRIMGERLGRVAVLCETGHDDMATAEAARFAAEVRASAEALKKQNSPLFTELGEWLDKYCLMADILDEAVKVQGGGGDKQRLADMMNAYNCNATVLTSFCFREYIERVLDGAN